MEKCFDLRDPQISALVHCTMREVCMKTFENEKRVLVLRDMNGRGGSRKIGGIVEK